VLLVSYCFGVGNGQALIGVYKRALRVGHALCDAGHDVSIYCPGRENYHDPVTRRAEARMSFFDVPAKPTLGEGAAYNRAQTLDAFRRARPDIIVVGEAPLAGPLLESTLAAVEMGVPVVCLDNAYGPSSVADFHRHHGAMFDAIVLSGPSSFHMKEPPPTLCQLPLYIDASADAAAAVIDGLGCGTRRVMTILAYDRNVETLGISVATKLDDPNLAAVFLTSRRDACEARIADVAASTRTSMYVREPLDDRALFGLLQASRLVVGKCAFMQLSECLTLRTPFIGFYFPGDFHRDLIPAECHPFTHMTPDASCDAATLDAARAFLAMTPDDMWAVHDGRLGAAAATVEFLEQLPRTPRASTRDDCAAIGLTPEVMRESLATRHPHASLDILDVRMAALRKTATALIYAVSCRYAVDGVPRVERMWLHVLTDDDALQAELARVTAPDSGRTLIRQSIERRAILEYDIGELALPPLHPPENRRAAREPRG
jgi:hypothetical protein